MLEEVIGVTFLTISKGAHLIEGNPNRVAGKEIAGTSGGNPFTSRRITIFPVGDKDAIHIYHSRGSLLKNAAASDGPQILGYFQSGYLELTEATQVSFAELNPKHWQGTNGHSGRIMNFHVRYAEIPSEDKKKVGKACPSPPPRDYK